MALHLRHYHLPLSLFHFLLLRLASADAPSGAIERTVKQQILATIPPGDPPNSRDLFLTSPSGKYAAYFLRSATKTGGGGFGNDFCFVQVVDDVSGKSAWESECAPVSSSNACTLVFDDGGLEVFDGSRQSWSSEANGFHPHTLQLVDLGDMRITDKEGELAWRATDKPRRNQGCGLPGSPGLSPETPPFAGAIGSGTSLPFGQPSMGSPPQLSAVAEDTVVGQSSATVPRALPREAVANGNYPSPTKESYSNAPPVVIGDGGDAVSVGESMIGQPAVVLAAPPNGAVTDAVVSAAPPNGAVAVGNYPPPTEKRDANAPPVVVGDALEPSVGVPSGGAAVAFERPAEGGVALSGQPLVDNTPYDSGCFGGFEVTGLAMALWTLMVVFTNV